MICLNGVLGFYIQSLCISETSLFLDCICRCQLGCYSIVESKYISESFRCLPIAFCLARVKGKAMWPGSLSSFVRDCVPRACCRPDQQDNSQLTAPNQIIPALLPTPLYWNSTSACSISLETLWTETPRSRRWCELSKSSGRRTVGSLVWIQILLPENAVLQN